MDRSALLILRHALKYERDRRMFARPGCSQTILIFEHEWPFVPTDDGGTLRH